jgi:hypothetical protein
MERGMRMKAEFELTHKHCNSNGHNRQAELLLLVTSATVGPTSSGLGKPVLPQAVIQTKTDRTGVHVIFGRAKSKH